MFVTKRSEEEVYDKRGIDASLVEDVLLMSVCSVCLQRERERERYEVSLYVVVCVDFYASLLMYDVDNS
jgi:hypothetical protein